MLKKFFAFTDSNELTVTNQLNVPFYKETQSRIKSSVFDSITKLSNEIWKTILRKLTSKNYKRYEIDAVRSMLSGSVSVELAFCLGLVRQCFKQVSFLADPLVEYLNQDNYCLFWYSPSPAVLFLGGSYKH